MKLKKKQLDLIYPRVMSQIRELYFDYYFKNGEEGLHILTSREVFAEIFRMYYKNVLFVDNPIYELKGCFAGYVLKTGSFYEPFILFMVKDYRQGLQVAAVYDILYDETHLLSEKQKMEIKHKVYMLFEKQLPIRFDLPMGVFFKNPTLNEVFQDNVLKVIQEMYPFTLERRIHHICDLAIEELERQNQERNRFIKLKSYKIND